MIENIFVVFISSLLFDVLELKCFTLNYCRDAIKFVEIFIAVVSCSFLLAFFQLNARYISEIRNQAFSIAGYFKIYQMTFFIFYRLCCSKCRTLKTSSKTVSVQAQSVCYEYQTGQDPHGYNSMNYQRHYHWVRSC